MQTHLRKPLQEANTTFYAPCEIDTSLSIWDGLGKKGGGGWMQNDHEDRARVGVEGLMTAVGSSSIRRCIIHDPRDMPMDQSKRSKQFEDLMTI